MAGSSSVPYGMFQFYDNAEFSDVTIKSAGKEIKAHRVVLCSKSEYFKKALGPNSPFKENKEGVQELHGDDPQALERMLRFMYTSKYPAIPGATAWEAHMGLVIIADKYAVPWLKTTAFDRVKNIVKSIPKTALDVPRLLKILDQYNIGTSDFDGCLEEAIFVQFCAIWSDEAVQQYLDGKAALKYELFGNIFQDVLDQPKFKDIIRGDGEMALGILREIQNKFF